MTFHKVNQEMYLQTQTQNLVALTAREWSRLHEMVADIKSPDKALCAQAYFFLGMAVAALFCVISFAASEKISPVWWVLAGTILLASTVLGFTFLSQDLKMQKKAIGDAQKVIREMDRLTPAHPGSERQEAGEPPMPEWPQQAEAATAVDQDEEDIPF